MKMKAVYHDDLEEFSMQLREKHQRLDEQAKMALHKQRILKRYFNQDASEKKKPRSINELYDLRYKSKFR